jgi:hypothetical protein
VDEPLTDITRLFELLESALEDIADDADQDRLLTALKKLCGEETT